ncbi:MAG: hypothetical protein R3304_09040 [Longimicrobiales bacterium]|nr:hypothetical protein [Longimicrobiales bacterium]
MGLDFLVPIFGILLLLVPITGVTAILTLRLGGKPFVETLALHMRGGRDGDLEMRLAELTEQVESLTAEVRELRAAQSFDEKLLSSGTAASRTPEGSGV